jgi:hypothetical protein
MPARTVSSRSWNRAAPNSGLTCTRQIHWGDFGGTPASKDGEIYIRAMGLRTPRQLACYLWHVLKIKELNWLPERDTTRNENARLCKR